MRILLYLAVAFCTRVNSAPIDKKLSPLFRSLNYCSFIITSGYRSPDHNKRIGGAKNSMHLQDRARDIVTNCKYELARRALSRGLTIILYKSHVHIDDRKDQKCLYHHRKNSYSKCPSFLFKSK